MKPRNIPLASLTALTLMCAGQSSADSIFFKNGAVISNVTVQSAEPALVTIRHPNGKTQDYFVHDLTTATAARLNLPDNPYATLLAQNATLESAAKTMQTAVQTANRTKAMAGQMEAVSGAQAQIIDEKLAQLAKEIDNLSNLLDMRTDAYKDLAKKITQYAEKESQRGWLAESQAADLKRIISESDSKIKDYFKQTLDEGKRAVPKKE